MTLAQANSAIAAFARLKQAYTTQLAEIQTFSGRGIESEYDDDAAKQAKIDTLRGVIKDLEVDVIKTIDALRADEIEHYYRGWEPKSPDEDIEVGMAFYDKETDAFSEILYIEGLYLVEDKGYSEPVPCWACKGSDGSTLHVPKWTVAAFDIPIYKRRVLSEFKVVAQDDVSGSTVIKLPAGHAGKRFKVVELANE